MIIFKENERQLNTFFVDETLSRFLQWLPTPAGIFNTRDGVLAVNPSAAATLNVQQMNALSLFRCHAEDQFLLRQIIEAGNVQQMTLRLSKSETETHWQRVQVTIVPVARADRESQALVFIDGLKTRETQLPLPLNNELIFKHLVEMAPIMIGIYIDDVVQYVNPTGVRLMGATSREDLVGRNIMEFIHPDSLPLVEKRRRALLKERVLPPVEERLIRLDGKIIDVEVVTAFIQVEGTPAILAVGQDITRRKETERALKESEERYFHLMQVSPNAIFIIKKAGIEYVNPAAIELLRVPSATTIMGQPIQHFLPALDGLIHRSEDPDWQGRSLETQLIPSTGDPITVDVIMTPVMLEGEVGVQLIIRDITQRKIAEQKLKESRDRLRELSAYLQTVREKERAHIAREIHDELGQMLTALKLELALLKRRLPTAQSLLETSVTEMIGMVDKTIKVVRHIASELRPEILNDLGLLAAIEWQAQEYMKRSGIKIFLQFDPDEFSVDHNRATTIFRIFQETLTNVMRHAHATEVFVTLRRKLGGLELVVEDNGVGIDEKEAEKRWSLGIMGIKERARFWNGTVEIKGVAGEGTRVRVWIPEENHG